MRLRLLFLLLIFLYGNAAGQEYPSRAVRMLVGKVDAAMMEPALHRSAEFASLQAEVDPA